jgi:hypothetical protein
MALTVNLSHWDSNLNKNHAVGCDEISARFYDRTKLFASEKITELVNEMIYTLRELFY